MNELELARNQINEIDEQMARLFESRMKACETVAAYKKQNGLSIRDPEREKDLINRNRSYVQDENISSYYVRFLKNTIDLSCAYQSRLMNGMKVAYSGVPGAFAYIAAKRMFPDAELVAFKDFTSAYESVEKGEMDAVVLPLENSYAGEVGTVMDLIFSGELFINQVIDLDIVHNLLAPKGAAIDSIKKVYSHPQALSQCDEFISAHNLDSEAYSNTAAAAEFVSKSGDTSIAAIASDETAKIFGLEIIERNINSSRSNTTRFAAFSRSQSKPVDIKKREDENFILVFTVQNEAGSLAQTLNIIGAHGFNMRNLRSRPMKDLLWNYYFFVEAEGRINSTNGREMLQELSATCAKLRLAGTYYSNNIG